MSKQGVERIHGPYQHGNRWKIVEVGANGNRASFTLESHEEACAYIERFRARINARTIGEAVTEYLVETEASKKPGGATTRYRLLAYLRVYEGDRLLSSLTAAAALKLHTARSAEVAFETLRGERAYVSRWAQWCVAKGWLRLDPFANVKSKRPPDDKGRGKPQLRVDEARRFVAHVITEDSPEATAVLVALLMGLRAHEVVERTVRDLDDNGRLLVIGKSKTKAGERTVVIPELVRGRLARLAEGKQPGDLLFGFTRHALNYHTVRLALEAGVPRVTPHGLRGTWATMVVTAGLPGMERPGGQSTPMTVATAAKTLGHADDGDTMRRHYMAPGAEQSAGVGAVDGLLNLGTGPEKPFPDATTEDLN